MGCSNSKTKEKRQCNKIDYNWKELIGKLSVLKEETNRQQRINIWVNELEAKKDESLDYEKVKKGMERYLGLCGDVLKKGPIKLAFDGAKDKYKKQGKNVSDEKLEFNEFRLFLIYLKQFFEYYQFFLKLDISCDNKISFEEFKKTVPKMKEFGLQVVNEQEVFDEIDVNKGGYISFDEFVNYAIKHSIEKETDDPDDVQALKLIVDNLPQ